MEVDLAIRDASGKIRTQRVNWLPKRASDGPHLTGVIIHTRPEVVHWVAGDIIQRTLRELEKQHAIGHWLNADKGTITIALPPPDTRDTLDMIKLLDTLRVLESKIRNLEEALEAIEPA